MRSPLETDIYGKPLADDFVCVICGRETRPDRWHPYEHKPPICRSCGIRRGHQARIPGMTRGDHITLQRLVAVSDALKWEIYRGAFFAK